MICVDASLATKWVLDEEDLAQASALDRDVAGAGRLVIAPPLLPIEATNILRQRMRRSPLHPRRASLDLLHQFLAVPVAPYDTPGLHREAPALADDCRLSAAYDAHYVALGQTAGCGLWTADQRRLRELGGKLAFVRGIGEYAG